MIAAKAFKSQAMKALPEADSRMLGNKRGECFLQQTVVLWSALIVISGGWQLPNFAGLANTALLLCNQKANSFSFINRP